MNSGLIPRHSLSDAALPKVRGAALLILLWLGVTGMATAQESVAPAGEPAAGFAGYPDAPSLSVVPRQDELRFFPCEQCHKFLETDPQVRELTSPHTNELEHGEGRLWCMNCHEGDDRDYLVTLLGERVDYDDSHLVCGGCHANRHRDWYFGAHGKRADNWQGERLVYNCTHCHDPHEPALEPRAPEPPPPVRTGLQRPKGGAHAPELPWATNRERSEEKP